MSVKKTGVELEPHMVIRRPLVTEKGVHASERLNAYAFEIPAECQPCFQTSFNSAYADRSRPSRRSIAETVTTKLR